jgi:hypothetical protein
MATLATYFRRPLLAAAASGDPATSFCAADDGFLLRSLPNEDVFLFSKRIDNSRIVREPEPKARRGEWSMIAALGLMALLFMGLITPRVANVFAGYQLESLKQEQQRLVDEQRELDLTSARLSREENLAALAKRRDLNTPTPGQIFHLDPKGDGKLAMNRR